MSDIAEPTDGLNADVYKSRSPTADKLLLPDGSVVTSDGVQLEPPDEHRAEVYKAKPAKAAKWLLPDGSIVDEQPTGGSGGGGSEVSKAYVDQRDQNTLTAAKAYTDSELREILENITPLGNIDGGTF